jgi:hypothetical protein
MLRPTVRAVLFALVMLLELIVSAWSGTPVRAQTDPDFTSVTDVLQGRRRLLPIDDLVATSPTGPGGAVNNVLPTSNSSIGTPGSYPITTASVPSFATAAGRMLNSPRDVVFTMTDGAVVVRDQNPA